MASDPGTTLYLRNLPEDVVRSAKVLAAQRGVTLRELVTEVLRTAVAGQASQHVPARGVAELDDDIAWYEANREEVTAAHPGEYVAIAGQVVIDHDTDLTALAERTLARSDGPVLVPDTKREQRSVHLRSPRVPSR